MSLIVDTNGKGFHLVLALRSVTISSSSSQSRHHASQLFSEEDHFAQPIARFLKSQHVLHPEPGVTDATLVLTPRATEIQDLVVASFLFLEKTRRIRDTTLSNVSSTMATPVNGLVVT